eukprot:1161545-Pelagomonas_calceolata.AAC.5
MAHLWDFWGPSLFVTPQFSQRKKGKATQAAHTKRCTKEGPTPTATRTRIRDPPPPGQGQAFDSASHFYPPVTYPSTWASSIAGMAHPFEMCASKGG